MKFNSIKSRMLLMLFICIIGMSLLIISQQFFTQKLVSLHQQHASLLRLGQDLLQMRRHEKDFLLRHQIDYYNRFTVRARHFHQQLDQLSPVLIKHGFPREIPTQLKKSMQDYARLFEQVVELQTQIGLSASLGLTGELAENERQMAMFSMPDGLFAKARLSAREFMLFQDPDALHQFYRLVSQAKADAASPRSAAVLDDYEATFTQLVSAMKTMGLTHSDGLRGRFRRQAHEVEELLREIDSALQPLIITQTRQVKLYSLVIAILTSAVLILLLIKSFATFHRAFANFVMFFYRCKREYQRIDPKQLGFAEFKSLAELANEMVESRRSTEERLAKTQAALDDKNNVKKQPGNL